MNEQQLLNKASSHFKLQEFHKAEKCIKRLFKATDEKWLALAHLNYGILLQSQGKFAEADSEIIKSIRIKTCYAALAARALNKKFKEDEGYHLVLIDALKEDPPEEDRCHLLFSLGKVCDDIGWYDKAFEAYKEANDIRNSTVPDGFNDHTEERFNHYIRELQDFAGDLKHGVLDSKLIFIVGMPRSGTTLLETALDKHPDIEGLGEVVVLAESYRRLCELTGEPVRLSVRPIIKARKHDLEKSGREFQKYCLGRANCKNKLFYIDKTPNNFRYLAYLKALYKDVKIIHTIRNPMDTLLSCYFQDFEHHQEWSFSFDGLARFYRSYQKIMSCDIGLDIHTVQYESLVEKPEEVIRGVLDYIGLPFNESCLATGRKNVITASMWQVQQPIYKTSVERWKNYEKHLEPLIELLDGIKRRDDRGLCRSLSQ